MTGFPCSLFDVFYNEMKSQLVSECIRIDIFDKMFAAMIKVSWTLPPNSEFILKVVLVKHLRLSEYMQLHFSLLHEISISTTIRKLLALHFFTLHTLGDPLSLAGQTNF